MSRLGVRRSFVGWAALAALVVVPGSGRAAIVNLPVANLPAGGGANFTFINNSGNGFSVSDADIGGQFDAFDDGLTIRVNGAPYLSPATVDLTGTTLTSGPVTLSGLAVTVQFFADPNSPTLRTLVSFTNPTAAALSAVVSLQTNNGSDGGTQTITTSSGDLAFTTADRFIITDDAPVGGDPTNTHVIFGAGAPLVTPSLVSTTVFANFGTEGVRADFNLTVGAGETQSLLFFNQIHTTAALALADAAVFNSNTAIADAGLLAGLTPAQLGQIVNFNFGPAAAAVPAPPALALAAVGATCLAGYRRWRGRAA
ncbi:MAG: hypothetical protein C0501_18095 [Isosphaera sp.]|nr:hypothetical protein [Isosphaera sp.]